MNLHAEYSYFKVGGSPSGLFMHLLCEPPTRINCLPLNILSLVIRDGCTRPDRTMILRRRCGKGGGHLSAHSFSSYVVHSCGKRGANWNSRAHACISKRALVAGACGGGDTLRMNYWHRAQSSFSLFNYLTARHVACHARDWRASLCYPPILIKLEKGATSDLSATSEFIETENKRCGNIFFSGRCTRIVCLSPAEDSKLLIDTRETRSKRARANKNAFVQVLLGVQLVFD